MAAIPPTTMVFPTNWLVTPSVSPLKIPADRPSTMEMPVMVDFFWSTWPAKRPLKTVFAPSTKSRPKMMTYIALTTGLGTATKMASNLEKGATAMVISPRYIPTLLAATPVKPMYTAVTAHGAATGMVPRRPEERVPSPYILRPL